MVMPTRLINVNTTEFSSFAHCFTVDKILMAFLSTHNPLRPYQCQPHPHPGERGRGRLRRSLDGIWSGLPLRWATTGGRHTTRARLIRTWSTHFLFRECLESWETRTPTWLLERRRSLWWDHPRWVLFYFLESRWYEVSDGFPKAWILFGKSFGRHCFNLSILLEDLHVIVLLHCTTQLNVSFTRWWEWGARKLLSPTSPRLQRCFTDSPRSSSHICVNVNWCWCAKILSRIIRRSNLNILQSQHLLAFLFAELGTSGAIDGSNQLIMKGGFWISLQCGQCL